MQQVLFLCTGNSCRSQMAEALVNQLAPGWRAYSAGTRPTGSVHPLAQRALLEAGIDPETVNGLQSKSTEAIRHLTFVRVYTVCDSAAEDCPVWIGGDVRHVPFFDPAMAEGSELDVLQVFRDVRDQIRSRIVDELIAANGLTS